MKKYGWIILTAVLAVVIGGAAFFYNKYSAEVENEQLLTEDSTEAEIETEETAGTEDNQTENDVADESTAMPDFTVYDADGNAVNLSDFIGKPVILNFWASWCGPCKMEMPDFDAKYQELGNDIHFLMVNMTDGSQETKNNAAAFIEEQGYSFPVYFDLDMDAAMTYGVTSIPSTYFIDAKGQGVAWAQGMIDAETLSKGIDMVRE